MADQKKNNELSEEELAEVSGGLKGVPKKIHKKCKSCSREFWFAISCCPCGCQEFDDLTIHF